MWFVLLLGLVFVFIIVNYSEKHCRNRAFTREEMDELTRRSIGESPERIHDIYEEILRRNPYKETTKEEMRAIIHRLEEENLDLRHKVEGLKILPPSLRNPKERR